MGRLDGKIAWVTGAGSGIGEATAVALAREGATVVLSGRRREPLEQVAARIGERAEVRPADVTVAAEVAAVADAIKERHGRLDVLVANAGMNVVERDWGRLTSEAAAAVIDGNLTSAFHCSLAVLPMMRAQGGLSGIPCRGRGLNIRLLKRPGSAPRTGSRTGPWPWPIPRAASSTPSPPSSRPGRGASARCRRWGSGRAS
jgi:NAD(P)-dependent dehydrogenase (short-subunit alcohol dehydrogenase family)